MSSSDNNKKIKYIYDLPYFERTELCKFLNQNDRWENLAGCWMKYDATTIQYLKNEKNPTEELLTMWSTHNHTIEELFILLSRIHHYRAMMILKPYVDPKYHVIVEKGEGNLKYARDRNKEPNFQIKDSKINQQNFNHNTLDVPAAPKVVINDENSLKILNKVGLTPPLANVPSNSNNLLVASPVLPDCLTDLSQKLNGLIIGQTGTTLPHISYNELTCATDGWNKHKILGKGGFGTVYRGTWKNTDVAIKKIARRGPESDDTYLVQLKQSLSEIKILNSRPHENILPLYAYSTGGDAPCLVYQFMSNGSLEDRLHIRHKTAPLTWFQRHEIAKGIARGLQYLHTIGDKPLIHGDIKSANILLDNYLQPRIGDFGLAREGPAKDSMKVSRIHGTRPYLPDEFLKGKILSVKIDTYSYGIVLFELATGLFAYDDSRPEYKFLKDFIDNWSPPDILLLKDKKAGDLNGEVFHNLIALGKWCSNKLADYRPKMELVFQRLNDL